MYPLASGQIFQVFQIADGDAGNRQPRQPLGLDRRHGGRHFCAHASEEITQHHQQVGVGGHGNPGHAQHEVAVYHRVLQLGALALQAGWHRLVGQLAQGVGEAVTGSQAHQAVKAVYRHAGARLQLVGSAIQRFTNHQRGNRLAQREDFAARGAADSQRRVFRLGQMAIQRVANIRHQHRAQTKRRYPVAQRFQIAGGEMTAGQHIHLFGPTAHALAGRYQGVDQRFHRQRVAGFQTAQRIRGVDRHHAGIGKLGVGGAEFTHTAVDVGALGFRQTGGYQANDFGFLLVAQRAQRFDHIVVSAHDAGHLVHGRGLQRNRLAEMAHKKHFAKRRTAL